VGDPVGLAQAEKEARRIAEDEMDPEAVAFGNLTSGFCLWARGHFLKAYEHLTHSAQILERFHHPALLRALNGRALCAAAFGEFTIATDSYNRALHLAERTGDYPAACNFAANAANTYGNLGLLDEAERLLEKAQRLERKSASSRYTYTTFLNLGTLRLMQRDLAGAEKSFKQALNAAQKSRLHAPLAGSLLGMADVSLARGFPEDALSFIAEGETVLNDLPGHATTTYFDCMARLLEYRAWRIGEAHLVDRTDREDDAPLMLAGFVELRIFREWRLEQNGQPTGQRPNARDLIRATGLEGLRLILEAVGMFPSV
jgi:tetratricopeptide (TPR) repeat protein